MKDEQCTLIHVSFLRQIQGQLRARSAGRFLSFSSWLLLSLEGFIVGVLGRTKIKLTHLRRKWGGERVRKVNGMWSRITESYNFLGRKKKNLFPSSFTFIFEFNVLALDLKADVNEVLSWRNQEHRLTTLKNGLEKHYHTSLKMSF